MVGLTLAQLVASLGWAGNYYPSLLALAALPAALLCLSLGCFLGLGSSRLRLQERGERVQRSWPSRRRTGALGWQALPLQLPRGLPGVGCPAHLMVDLMTLSSLL